MCLVAYLLWQLRDRVRPGVVFALYLVLSGLERFLVEFIRRNNEVLRRADGAAAGERRAAGDRARVAGGDGAREWPERTARSDERPAPDDGLTLGASGPRPAAWQAIIIGDGYRDESFARISARQPAERARPPGGRRLRHDRAGEEFGTPAYVVAEDDLRARARAFVQAGARGRSRGFPVVFASKAFPCTAVLEVFAQEGLWCDVASGGELHLALNAGFAPERIVMHGNAKSEAELRMALDVRVGSDRGGQLRRARTPGAVDGAGCPKCGRIRGC